MDSLRTFYDQALISDVLAIVKGGKEASVYRCEPHPSLNMEYVAAKVYRPRMFRQLRNDKTYREGREILSTSGKAVRENDLRSMRAIGKGTSFGQQMAHTSWLMHEYVTLQKLHDLGAAVPKPVGSGENAILMGYCGDGYMPAPTLERVALEPGEAEPLFNEVLRNIDLMIQHGMIHGDLSAYNILYWDGDITLIDFPQVTDAHQNPNAFRILSRDVTRVCEYFAGQGVECDAEAIVHELWRTYAATDPEAEAADLSRLLEDPFEE
jgi:RIO kinase 1